MSGSHLIETVMVNDAERRHMFMSFSQLSPFSVLYAWLVEIVLNFMQPPLELTLADRYCPA